MFCNTPWVLCNRWITSHMYSWGNFMFILGSSVKMGRIWCHYLLRYFQVNNYTNITKVWHTSSKNPPRLGETCVLLIWYGQVIPNVILLIELWSYVMRHCIHLECHSEKSPEKVVIHDQKYLFIKHIMWLEF